MSSVGDFVLLEPAAGRQIDLGLGCPTIKVDTALSVQVDVVEGEVPPGGGFQIPHWHEDLDEVFYVLAGEIEFLLDGQWRRAVAGSTVFVAAGVPRPYAHRAPAGASSEEQLAAHCLPTPCRGLG